MKKIDKDILIRLMKDSGATCMKTMCSSYNFLNESDDIIAVYRSEIIDGEITNNDFKSNIQNVTPADWYDIYLNHKDFGQIMIELGSNLEHIKTIETIDINELGGRILNFTTNGVPCNVELAAYFEATYINGASIK